MNCIAKSIKKVLNLDIYAGVGHREPIHWSEVIAFLLSKGYATVPADKLKGFPGVAEGDNCYGQPHMVPIGEPLHEVAQNWYFIPVEVNEEYAKRFNETVRMAGGLGGIPCGASCCDGENT